ncbi:MAG TPA: GTPase HflX, partial [Verrucomicrobiales bacterium]|nr:GTPase HflX [Verrucomicrobiales bacterium]
MFEVRDRPQMVERALLVRICFDKREEEESRSLLNELAELVGTLGIGVVGDQLVRARETQKKFLCGKGKAEEVS